MKAGEMEETCSTHETHDNVERRDQRDHLKVAGAIGRIILRNGS
jgi:hypothetical protein